MGLAPVGEMTVQVESGALLSERAIAYEFLKAWNFSTLDWNLPVQAISENRGFIQRRN